MAELPIEFDDENLKLIVTSEKLHKHAIPPFQPIGREGISKHKIEGLNAASILKNMTGKSGWLFWLLVEHKGYETNICNLNHVDLSATESKRLPRARVQLRDAHLIRYLGKGRYLINPKVILPSFKYYERTWEYWVEFSLRRGLLTGPLLPDAVYDHPPRPDWLSSNSVGKSRRSLFATP